MKSSQLLILGNGFDVHCGLKSQYKDFFRSEILDTRSEPFGIIQTKAGVSGFWEEILLEYYKIKNKDDYNWCDIEKIIKDTLLSIYIGNDNSKYDIHNGLCYKASMYIYHLTATLHLEKLSDIEKFIFNYCVKFISTNGGEYKDNIKPLIENLFQQLRVLERRFCKYLKNQIINPNNENEWNEQYIINSVNLLADLTKFTDKEFKSMDEIIDNLEYEKQQAKKYDIKFEDTIYLCGELYDLFNTNILSFNYTALFDILKAKSPCKYSNVHGKLCSGDCATDCSGSSIIFGIDDRIIQTQDANSELRLFSKTYRKMLDSGDPISILPPNDQPVDIIFYRHSLSEADYSYFQSIFDYYDLYGNNNVSLIFYYSKNYENHEAIYRLISEYGKSLTNKDQGKNLIHKLLLENQLHIQEI